MTAVLMRAGPTCPCISC